MNGRGVEGLVTGTSRIAIIKNLVAVRPETDQLSESSAAEIRDECVVDKIQRRWFFCHRGAKGAVERAAIFVSRDFRRHALLQIEMILPHRAVGPRVPNRH